MDWEAGWETRRLSIRYRISECILVHSVASTEGACRGTAFSHCPAAHRDAKLILRLSSLIRHAVHVRGGGEAFFAHHFCFLFSSSIGNFVLSLI